MGVQDFGQRVPPVGIPTGDTPVGIPLSEYPMSEYPLWSTLVGIPAVGRREESGLLEVHLRLLYKRLSARGAFALTIQAFARFWIKNVKKAFDFPKKN